MQNDKFYRMGKFIYSTRWAVFVIYLLLLGACIPFLPSVMSKFSSTGFVDPHTESAQVDQLLNDQLGYKHNQFIVLYTGKGTFSKRSNFNEEIKNSLAKLKDFPFKHEIIYPDQNSQQVSQDKHSAFAVVMLKDNQDLSAASLQTLVSLIKKPASLQVQIGGQPIFVEDTKTQTQKDLVKAELIASPVAVLTLLAVFGSVIAAFVPMILDGICAIFILTILFFVGHYFSLSIFTINIALLLGLCLSLDYALFIISRFKDELQKGHHTKEALAITLATAGKAVFFSGLAVFISLSALLMFPINILFSVGAGGITAVAVAVIVSIILLPAILAMLGTRINFIPIRIISNHRFKTGSYWSWLVNAVVHYPKSFFIFIMAILLCLSYPLLSVEFGLSDYKILPKHLESRQVFERIDNDFSKNQLTPISIVAESTRGDILSKRNIAALYRYTRELERNKYVENVDSIVNTKPNLSSQQYQMLYTNLGRMNDPGLKQLLKLTTTKNFTVITVLSKFPGDAEQSKTLIKQIRDSRPGNGLTVKVSGFSANLLDVFTTINRVFYLAILWIIVLTYLILLMLLRSLFLPVKAIVMTILSLCASYGVLVFVVQQGYFSEWLDFQTQGMLDVSLLIIIFCALFGFSMDYEVFLLSRIKECYEQTGNNIQSIRVGITQSSKIISSAAIIVILICFSFITAHVVMVKAFGLGIAVAIFVDAFLIRTLLVPATMALLGKWNWYLPKWLGKILPRSSFNPKEG